MSKQETPATPSPAGENNSVFERYDGRQVAAGDASATPLWKTIAAAALTALVVCLLWWWLMGAGTSGDSAAEEQAQQQQEQVQAQVLARADGADAQIAALKEQLSALQAQLGTLPNADALNDSLTETIGGTVESALAPVTEQLNAVQGEVVALTERTAAREAQPTVDPTAIGATVLATVTASLGGQLEAVKTETAQKTAALATEISNAKSAADSQLANLQTDLGALKGVTDALVSDGEAMKVNADSLKAGLEDRLETLSAAVSARVTESAAAQSQALESGLSALKDTMSGEMASAMEAQASQITDGITQTLGAQANRLQAVHTLRTALDTGAPLQSALESLKPFADEQLSPVIDQLSARAAEVGVPSKSALMAQFDDVASKVRAAAQSQAVAKQGLGGLTQRLSSALSASDSAGSGPASEALKALDAMLDPFSAALQSDDAAGAIAAFNGFDGGLREAMGPVINGALARRDGLAANLALENWLSGFGK